MTSRNLWALLLCTLLLTSLLLGCSTGTTTSTTTDTTTPADTTDTTTPVEDTPDEAPVAEPDDASTYDRGGLTLPLVDEPTTLTAFRSFSNQYISDPNEIGANQVLEERTGIHIDFTTYSLTEQFYLFIAGQEFTDLIYHSNLELYTGGIDKAIEDEVYVDGTPYLSLMPNFSNYLNSNPDIHKQCVTDTGHLFFNNVQSGNQPAWLGPMVRTDWLADCGLDTPVTYDDWYEMLVAFRDQCGATAALSLPALGYSTTGFGLTSGYDVVPTFYAENGTTVKYGFIEPAFRDYMEMMVQWYAEDLIDIDFMSRSGNDNQALFTSNETGAYEEAVYVVRDIWSGVHPEEDADICAVPFPSRTADQQGSLHFRRVNEICGTTPIFITTAAVARGVDEVCARWLDYRYSEEGAFILNYGVEGTTWTLGEDGLPHFTDFYLHNDEYLASEMGGLWTDSREGCYYMWIREKDTFSADVLAAYDIWNASATGDWVMPPTTMTALEAEDYNSIYSNIETYVNEMFLRFLTGDMDMSQWDGFIEEIKNMGIDECIAIKQAALDRYNNR